MVLQVNGFLLIDSSIGLIIASLFIGCGLFWQQQMHKKQLSCSQMIEAHALACSVRDQLIQGKTYPAVSSHGPFELRISIDNKIFFVEVYVEATSQKLIELIGYQE